MSEQATFDIEISQAQIIKKYAPMVRFTLTWRFRHTSETGRSVTYGDTTQGCLLRHTKTGEVVWNHPMIKTGFKSHLQTHQPFPDYYEVVLKLLRDKGLVAKLGPFIDWRKQKSIQDIKVDDLPNLGIETEAQP